MNRRPISHICYWIWCDR